MVLLIAFLVALAVTIVLYPFARALGRLRREQERPTWWSLKLHSGDAAAALAEDRARHEARVARRERWRRRLTG